MIFKASSQQAIFRQSDLSVFSSNDVQNGVQFGAALVDNINNNIYAYFMDSGKSTIWSIDTYYWKQEKTASLGGVGTDNNL